MQVLVIYHGELVHCDQALYCYVIRVLDGSRAGLVLTAPNQPVDGEESKQASTRKKVRLPSYTSPRIPKFEDNGMPYVYEQCVELAGAAVQSRPDAGQFDVWPAYYNEPLRFFASGRTKAKLVNVWCAVFEEQLGIHHTVA